MKLFRILAAAAALAFAGDAHAAETRIAVAANFTDTAKEIATAFTAATGHEAVLSFGSSGTLYTQITQDAPFEVLLSADNLRTEQAVKDGLGVPGSTFTYAVGKLVLWSRGDAAAGGEAALKANRFAKLSIANPAAAPYGAAAIEALKALGVYDVVQPKIVQGNNISQAYQFVATGNAELGFVALSQVIASSEGSRWEVPQTLYTPILQDAVLLKKGAANEAATAFLTFLKGPEAGAIIKRYGYGLAGAK